MLKAYGAEVVVTPTAVAPDSPESYYGVSDRLAREIPGAFKPDQYSNPNGPRHYETTGPEIWRDTEGKITHFVAGVGTGGTITGTGRYLREVSGDRVRNHRRRPRGVGLLGRHRRPYFVEGVGEDFWPSAYDPSVPHEIIAVSDAESFAMTRRLARGEGILVGGSSGMAVVAALKAAASAGPDDVVRRAAARLGPRLPRQDLQRQVAACVRLRQRARGRTRCATCSTRRPIAPRRSSTCTRTTPCARRSTA